MSTLVLLMVLAAAEPSKETLEAAKSYFDAGKRAYRAGQYETAALAFREALSLAPRAEIVFSTAQAQRLQYFVDRDVSNLEEAVELYGRYVKEVSRGGRRDDAVRFLAELEPLLRDERARRPQRQKPRPVEETQLLISSSTPGAKAMVDGKDASELPWVVTVSPGTHKLEVTAEGHAGASRDAVALAGKLIVVELNLTPLPAKLEVTTESGAEISVDGRPFGEAPMMAPIELEAGRHFVAVTAAGRVPFVRELEVGRGEAHTISAELVSTTQRSVASGFLVSAGTLAAASAGLGVLALVAQGTATGIGDGLSAGANLSEVDRARYESSRELRDGARAAALATLGGAVVVGVLGLVLQLSDHPSVEARPKPDETKRPIEPEWEP
ncbi:MAG: PEGA domain-containing protein [Deltaproteobacteria bacterium]|nr:PEGA domain-containing protein [Deltaproteobacteria bacterium]